MGTGRCQEFAAGFRDSLLRSAIAVERSAPNAVVTCTKRFGKAPPDLVVARTPFLAVLWRATLVETLLV